MSKYEPLRKFLAALDGNLWHSSFADIEKVLGFPLPDSARKHSSWWSNSEQGSSGSAAWRMAGWRTETVSLRDGEVTFFRGDAARPTVSIPKPSPVSVPVVVESIETRLRMDWTSLGHVTLAEDGKVVFPTAPATPGLYRLAISLPGNERRYVGEAVNLSRRFGNYRHPGPTQQTSLRINAVLKKALVDGAVISVAVVVSGAWIEIGGGERREAELKSKVVRCLLENAAILASGGEDIELLNRAD